ncbi:hydroxychlorobactene glucosyltransferase CruC [soil metagenome]
MQLVLAMPWLLLLAVVPLLLMRRTRISAYPPPAAGAAPKVSVIVPARNEASSIGACLASLLNSVYPDTEIVVVDDNSADGTADIVRILAEHSKGQLRMVEGAPLPAGWLGKPWACWQGYQEARGELLLFTDADTRHDDALLGHAVGALQARGADMLSVLPRQLMQTFWERLIQPQIFMILTMRYHNLERISRTRNPRDVLANGQFILVRREAYEATGGHEALRGEVVEDVRLAQRMVEAGRRIFVAHGVDLMETRMYRSLAGLVEGWSKNLARGSRHAAPPLIAPAVPWLIALFIAVIWVLPPVMLVAALFTPYAGAALGWSFTATAASLVLWAVVLGRMRVPLPYAAGYPLGAVVAAGLFIRSAVRGSRIEWKGRRYDISADSSRDGIQTSSSGIRTSSSGVPPHGP